MPDLRFLWSHGEYPQDHAVRAINILLCALPKSPGWVKLFASDVYKMCKTLDAPRDTGVDGANHFRDHTTRLNRKIHGKHCFCP
ncbi:hypothetical protein GWA01_11640 [Gluconobacter wancherniae NBRC 103581]|uniref:Uncharacterized protein n=1 Tax=Gluconobacter wancherniae NBRC 103581 TaxID=656744 RepID=A0A511AYV8_9PROT|nr:hypothetical protein AA103581_2278 [Gluconobacter wancherniae NBRC 103581]GEK93394.1 hypothetical protein GWA01_11640 [Gluconobacter wancherniae NBRC 103581]